MGSVWACFGSDYWSSCLEALVNACAVLITYGFVCRQPFGFEVHSLANHFALLTPSTQAFAMTATTVSAVQKVDDAYVEDASKNATDSSEQEIVVREFDPKFMRKTMLKVCLPCYRVPRVLLADFL